MKRNMARAAESLRLIAAVTTDLPDDSPTNVQLRDRLEFAADVLNATSEAPG
jgi:hypothetical protein